MLFLAVTLGFFVENQREHYVEHQREKQYMASLYQDLKTDTLNLSILLKSKMDEIANYDSVFDIFRSKKYLQETSDVYYFGRKLLSGSTFFPTDGTIKQLENSGGFRLIRSRAVVDSIQAYQLVISKLKNGQDAERDNFAIVRSLMGKIFDANVFDKLLIVSSNTIQRPDKNYPLMPFTAAELNDFHLPIGFIKRGKITQTFYAKILQRKASNLMKLLQEKYKIKQD